MVHSLTYSLQPEQLKGFTRSSFRRPLAGENMFNLVNDCSDLRPDYPEPESKDLNYQMPFMDVCAEDVCLKIYKKKTDFKFLNH